MSMIIMTLFLSFIFKTLSPLVQVLMFNMMMLLMTNLSINNNLITWMFNSDMISLYMIMLTWWVGLMLINMKSNLIVQYNSTNMYFFFCLSLTSMLFFLVDNMFIFFFFFEVSGVIMMLLVLGWGYQPERVVATYYLLFYSYISMLPLMLVFYYFYAHMNISSIYMLAMLNINNLNLIVFLMLVLCFLVKLPMFGLHFWLPKVHVEASTMGSMFLAGIFLKLGGYGLLRLIVCNNKMNINGSIIMWNLIGGIMCCLLCFFNQDYKLLIAYSSVSHMSGVVCSIFILNEFSLYGSLTMMLSHGLSSTGLFLMSGIIYTRMKSRCMYFMKGMNMITPMLVTMLLMFVMMNFAFPPFYNLLAELMLCWTFYLWSKFTLISFLSMSFLSCAFSIYLYYNISYALNNKNFNVKDLNINEYSNTMFFIVPNLILFFISSQMMF